MIFHNGNADNADDDNGYRRARSSNAANERTCRQVVAPLQLDLGRFAEFDDQLSLGERASGAVGVGQSGYAYTLRAIVVHDGGMCVASIHTRVHGGGQSHACTAVLTHAGIRSATLPAACTICSNLYGV